MTYEDILPRLGAYRSALASERRAAHAGQKQRPSLSPIREAHQDIFSQDSIVALRELIERTLQPKKRDQMERTLFALLEGSIDGETLAIEEKISAKTASLETGSDGLKISYYEITARIARHDDPNERMELSKARAALCEELTPLRQDREHAIRQAIAKFGFGTEREFSEAKKRIKYDAFLQKTLPILEETTGLYRRVMSDSLRRAYGQDLGEIEACHVAHWLSGNEFAHLFPPERCASLCAGAFATIGLPLEAAGQIRVDAEQRPGKRPETAVFVVHAPQEIHVVQKPQGGFEDMRSLLCGLGRALAPAFLDPSLPYEHRELPRSQALPQVFAALMAHLPENPIWLEHVMHVPKAASERLAAWSLLGNLYRLRLAVASLSYQLVFDEKPYDAARNKELYFKTLRDLTGVKHGPEFWMEGVGTEFESADMLRAAIASAQLEEHLVRTYGDRWFLKRDTGAFLKSLLVQGFSWDAEALIQSLGMTAWDPLPLIRKFDGVSRLLR